MGKNQSASNLTNVIQISPTGNVLFVSGSTTLMSISSSGAITTTGVISGSNALSASYAANADTLDGLDSTVFTLTSSFNAFSSSILTQTASLNSFSSSILATTASLNLFSSSVLTFTGSAATRLGALESYTSSLNAKTASFATTGSNTFIGTQTISGSVLQSGSFTSTGTLTAQTLVVQTITSSVVYSSGSNIFGNAIGNTQTFTGSVLVTGSLTIAGASSATSYNGATIFGSTIACSPIGCFATSCATSFIGGTLSGTTIYGSTAVCSPVGKFTSCIDAGSGTFSDTLQLNKAGGLAFRAYYGSGNNLPLDINVDASNGDASLTFNTTYNAGWKYYAANYAARISNAGTLKFQVAPAGAAGCAITWVDALAFNNTTGAAIFSSTINGTTIYGSTAVCSPIGKFTSCIDVGGTGTFSGDLTLSGVNQQLNGGTTTGRISVSNSSSTSYITLTGNTYASTPNIIYFVNNAALTLTLNANNTATFAGNVCAPTFVIGGGGTAQALFIPRTSNSCYGLSIGEQSLYGDHTNVIRTAGGTSEHLFISAGLNASSVSGYIRLGADRDNNVGINIAPKSTLDVATTSVGDNVASTLTLSALTNAAYGQCSIIQAFVNDSGNAECANIGSIQFIKQRPAGNSIGGDMIFSTRNFAASGMSSPTEKMRITSCGKVGILATDPKWLLEICCNTTATGGGGYPAIAINNPNDAGYSALYFFKGSTNMGGLELSNATCHLFVNTNCTFAIQTNNIERLRVNNNGYISIGANTAIAPLAVYVCANTTSVPTVQFVSRCGDGSAVFTTIGGSDSWHGIALRGVPSCSSDWSITADNQMSFFEYGSDFRFYLKQPSSMALHVQFLSGTIYAVSTSISAISDIRLKENIRDISYGLNEIIQLKPKMFDWKEGHGTCIKDNLGFIAQDVETLLPELVTEWSHTEGVEAYKTLKMGDMIPVLVKGMQEQQCTICSQASMINTLKTCLGIV